MNIKQQIERDIKTAMLAGDKTLTTTLRGLKSAILYGEVSAGKRDSGLPEDQVISLLQKESKKRQESAELYRSGGNQDKAQAEQTEKAIIDGYLPEQLAEEDIRQLIEAEVAKLDQPNMQQMGKIIAAVKNASNGAADGGVVARLVKERLSQ